MQFDRFEKELEDARQAGELLNNPVFSKAVSKVLNEYAKTEERLVLEDNGQEFREQMRRVQHLATMRRCVLDVVSELDAMIQKGNDLRSLEEDKSPTI